MIEKAPMSEITRAPGYTSAQTVSVLTGASLMLTMSMGMRQSFGLFVGPVTQDLGVSVADFTLAIAIQNFTWGLTQPLIGAFADRFGCRAMTILGSLLYAAGLGVTMLAEGPIALWIGLGFMVGLALACTGLSLALAASARSVSAAKRSVTLGTISAAGSIGTFIAAPLAQGLMASDGWLMAMVGFLGMCVVMIPAAFFTGAGDKVALEAADASEASSESGAGMSVKEVLTEAWQHKGYVTMSVAYFVCGLQLIFIAAHLPVYLEICGQSPTLGAQAFWLHCCVLSTARHAYNNISVRSCYGFALARCGSTCNGIGCADIWVAEYGNTYGFFVFLSPNRFFCWSLGRRTSFWGFWEL